MAAASYFQLNSHEDCGLSTIIRHEANIFIMFILSPDSAAEFDVNAMNIGAHTSRQES